jgi:CBS domain-containing protein
MRVLARDIMQPHVVAVKPDATLIEVADLLINRRIGVVPVVEHDAVVGIVSRSDFARVVSLERALAGLVALAEAPEEFAPGEQPEPLPLPPDLAREMQGRSARDIMAPTPIVVSPETPVREVAALLVGRHVHHVVVADAGGLRGVVSALDIVRLVTDGRLREA